MLVVGGPSGSGKSSLLPLAETGFDHFNVDDRCAALNNGSYQKISGETRDRANKECEEFIDEHIRDRKSFAVETTLRSDITFTQVAQAKTNGFFVYLEYIATDGEEENVERVKIRADGGGHSAPPWKIREIYRASLQNLPRAVREFDAVTTYDNTVRGRRPRLVLRAYGGRVTHVSQDPPRWLTSALKGTDYRIEV